MTTLEEIVPSASTGMVDADGSPVQIGDSFRIVGQEDEGVWVVSRRQPFAPDAVHIYSVDGTGRWTGSTRTVAPSSLRYGTKKRRRS